MNPHLLRRNSTTLETSASQDDVSILFVTYRYPPQLGGMQKLSHLLTTTAKTLASDVRVVAWGLPSFLVPVFAVYALPLACVWIVSRKLAKKKKVAVHLCDPLLAPFGVLLKLLFRIPVAITAHGLDISYPNRLYQIFFVSALRRLDAIVCISHATMQQSLQKGLPLRKLTVIPIGIESPTPTTTPSSPVAIPHRLGQVLDSSRTILTVGRLVKRKGIGFFISEVFPKIAAACPNAVYVVVGDGPCRKELENEVRNRRLEGKVLLFGRVSEEMKNYLYRRATLFVMPNIPVRGDMEGFGIVALEAAQHGLCVVAARLEGIEDAITDGANGFLIQAQDANAFARTIIGLLGNEAKRRQLAQEAQEFTRLNHSVSVMTKQYLEVLINLARQRTLLAPQNVAIP